MSEVKWEQTMIRTLTIAICFTAFSVFSILPTPQAEAGQVETGISYGTDPRQKYDLYYPDQVTQNTPVLFFIYGGSWDSGEREKYDFVGRKFSGKNYIVAVPDYRLFPQVRFPAFVEDAANAFAAVKSRLGAERPIFVAGHSAGAQIGALLALDETYLALHGLKACSAINGFIGLAGPYDFKVTAPKYQQIFPTELRPNSQAINFADGAAPPTLLLHGAADTTVHAEDSEILGRKLTSSGNKADVKIYPLVTHVSIIAEMAPLMGLLAPTTEDMLDFMQAHRARANC